MNKRFLKKSRQSIFAKQLLILFITGICIFFIVEGLFRNSLDNLEGTAVSKNIARYTDYLLKDIGQPPDLNKARRLAEEISCNIIYQDSTSSWSTSEHITTINELPEMKVIHLGKKQLKVGEYKNRHFLLIDNDPGQFAFISRQNIFWAVTRWPAILTAAILIAVVLTGSYYATRYVLLPVRALKKGINKIGEGDLDHHVPVKTTDELGLLSAAFNDMTDRIRSALKINEQLLLDVSHELRSPLTRMKLSVELLEDNKFKESLKEDLNDMEIMVTEILETARIGRESGQLNKKKVDLAKLIADVAQPFGDQPPGVNITCTPGPMKVMVDNSRMATVFRNILTNAYKFSRENSPPVEISIIKEAGAISIFIKDNGRGISAEDLPYVFEPFYRADKSRTSATSGFGLGLSLCKTIMAAHKGSISIESDNQETTVSLTLPLN
jgi:signal transduction histidine kinase